MAGRPSAGKGTKDQIEQFVASRQFAEAVQKAVGYDKLMTQVRYGNFAENGAIKPQYVPQGMSPNLLPAKWAEYESYTLDAPWTGGTDVSADDGTINTILNRKVLLTKAVTSTPSSATLPYLDAQWNKFGPDGQTYIYSTDAVQYNSGITDYVGLKIEAASDASGTGAEIVYETPDTTTDMWTVASTQGSATRVYAKFALPAGKAYMRIKHKMMTNASSLVGWTSNQLEMVGSYRSFPSKYAAPTPKAGELSVGQMAFGLGKNLLPYGQATLSDKLKLPTATSTLSDLYVLNVQHGQIQAAKNGTGYAFMMNADATYHRTGLALIPTSAPAGERLQVGAKYIMSCDVTNLTNTDITLDLRVRGATTASDANALTSMTLFNTTTYTIPANSTEPVRVYSRFTVPSGAVYGPNVDWRATRATGTSSGLYNEVSVQNLMLERVPSGTTQIYPSAYNTPIIGMSDLTLNQQPPVYSGFLNNASTHTIATGADQVQPASWVWSQGFDTSAGGNWTNYFWAPVAGMYLVQVALQSSTSTTSATRMRLYLSGDIGSQNIAQMAIPNTTGGTFSFMLTGSAVFRLELATGFEIHLVNNSTDGRTIDNVWLWITYLGRYGT